MLAAREVVTNAALRGQNELLNRMARSHSVDDVSARRGAIEPDRRQGGVIVEEILEEVRDAYFVFHAVF